MGSAAELWMKTILLSIGIKLAHIPKEKPIRGGEWISDRSTSLQVCDRGVTTNRAPTKYAISETVEQSSGGNQKHSDPHIF